MRKNLWFKSEHSPKNMKQLRVKFNRHYNLYSNCSTNCKSGSKSSWSYFTVILYSVFKRSIAPVPHFERLLKKLWNLTQLLVKNELKYTWYCDSKAPMERMIQFEGTVKVTVNQGNRFQLNKSLSWQSHSWQSQSPNFNWLIGCNRPDTD